MFRVIDRVIERIVPKATASACSGRDVCLGGITFWRWCCPNTGCEYTYVHQGC